MNKINILLVGNIDSDKSDFVNKLISERFFNENTGACNITTFYRDTNIGVIEISIWNCSDDPKYNGMMDGYYINANAAIIMNSTTLHDEIRNYYTNIYRVCYDIPVMILTNNKPRGKFVNIHKLTSNRPNIIGNVYINVTTNEKDILIKPIKTLCERIFGKELIFY